MCDLLRDFNKGIKRHPYGAGTIGAISDHSHCVTVAYAIELTSGEGSVPDEVYSYWLWFDSVGLIREYQIDASSKLPAPQDALKKNM